MNERQQDLLKIIIQQYTKNAQPVSSKSLTEDFELSPATIRNEMAALEEDGYIFHPHTSAGRIPSERGYRFYIENFLTDSKANKKQTEALQASLATVEDPRGIKELAKALAELSDNAVFIAFSSNDFYYTGVSNLFKQPEFVQQQLIYRLSQVIDHFDQVINQVYQRIGYNVEIFLGDDNPFSADCGTVMTQCNIGEGKSIIGILGPQRMDYQQTVNLLKTSQELINNFTNHGRA